MIYITEQTKHLTLFTENFEKQASWSEKRGYFETNAGIVFADSIPYKSHGVP
jgi:hypothetical protein